MDYSSGSYSGTDPYMGQYGSTMSDSYYNGMRYATSVQQSTGTAPSTYASNPMSNSQYKYGYSNTLSSTSKPKTFTTFNIVIIVIVAILFLLLIIFLFVPLPSQSKFIKEEEADAKFLTSRLATGEN